MTKTEEKILDVFRKFKTAKDGIIKPQSIYLQKNNWDRRSQDEFQKSLYDLLANDYISVNENWFVLTEKGYDYIYRNYSIEDTKDLILNVFYKHNIGVNEILMPNSFISIQQNAERFHFDNFQTAFDLLISEEYVEITDTGFYKLTQKGYDKIY